MKAGNISATAIIAPADAIGATSPTHHRAGFRPDIEGLRALAILPILFNHAHVHGFWGGFIGVDIFFVISGYLISGILARDVAAGQYSIATFYRRRVLRIFPALFVTLAGTTALAWLAMTPPELSAYGRSLLATILFGSNIQFWNDTGYFTAAAASRPLLHTWSLAVEEQFYLFWPLLLAFVGARRRATMIVVVALVTTASFALALWMMPRDMSGAFYLIPFRAWELGIGGLLALVQREQVRPLPRWLRELAGLAGAAAIVYCIRYYLEPIDFPGWNAVAPCLGTVAIILAGPDTIVGRALALAPVRFFGLISYSLYLWHWPVIVFARLWLFLPSTAPVIAGEIAVSIALATLSYYAVEIGLRRRFEGLTTPRLLGAAAAAMAAGAAVAAILLIGRGFPERFDPHRVALAHAVNRNEDSYRRGSCFVLDGQGFDAPACLSRRGSGPTILLVGDSTAAHLWPGLERAATDYDVRQATMIGCTPELHATMRKELCSRFFGDLLTRWAPAHRPAAVMLAGNWQPKDVVQMRRTLAVLRAQGQRTIVIGPMPRYTSALPRLLFFANGPNLDARARGEIDPTIWSIDRGLRAVAADGGAAYLSPLALLCPGGRCRVLATRDVPMQFDHVHLTAEGSVVAIRAMLPGIAVALAAPAPGPAPADKEAR